MIIIFVLTEFGAIVYAETYKEKSSTGVEETSSQKGNETLKHKPEENLKATAKEKQNSNWPVRFIPSEKIKVDSSVPFPVDI